MQQYKWSAVYYWWIARGTGETEQMEQIVHWTLKSIGSAFQCPMYYLIRLCCRGFIISYKLSIIVTHWSWVTHICISTLTIIGSDNGLSPEWHQAIISTNTGILLIHICEMVAILSRPQCLHGQLIVAMLSMLPYGVIIYIYIWINIGSDKGFLPIWHQATTWTYPDLTYPDHK